MVKYRELSESELDRELFRDFVRHQVVKDCWRKCNGQWTVRPDPFVDDWSEEDFQVLLQCLKNTVRSGGFLYAAFREDKLKGFVSVEAELFGGEQKYLDLTSLHVSEDMRGRGIGRTLFEAAKNWAAEKGARKLYISAHSAVETQSFYRAMGCVEAEAYCAEHVEREPFDCQLECAITQYDDTGPDQICCSR